MRDGRCCETLHNSIPLQGSPIYFILGLLQLLPKCIVFSAQTASVL
jgi:hypothetical protein